MCYAYVMMIDYKYMGIEASFVLIIVLLVS